MSARVRRVVALGLGVLAIGAVPAHAQAPGNPALWATVNSCDPADRPGAVGIRVSMPARGGASQWVRIRIQFFDRSSNAWRVVRRGGDTEFTRLSRGGAPVMGGTTFMFTPPKAGSSVKLRGLVDFQWRRGRRVVSSARRHTSAGHTDPDDPLLAVSQATCDIAR